MILHCIDSSSEDPFLSYKKIRKELETYSKELALKYEVILLTKTDLIDKNALDLVIKKFKKIKKEVLTVSVLDDFSVKELKDFLVKKLRLV